MPKILENSIGSIFDPVPDGNCGFRCVAESKWNDNNQWPEVQKLMAEKMVEDEGFFTKILGGKDELKKILENVSPTDCSSFLKKDYWLSNIDMGQFLSDTLNLPVCFWYLIQSSCYVPHKSSPPSDVSCTPLHLCSVSDSHWVLLLPKSSGSFPIPPICKVPKGYNRKFNLWQTHLKEGLSAYDVVK